MDRMESFRRREQGRLKRDIYLGCILARQVGANIAKVLDTDGTYTVPECWDLFPELFAEEKEEAEKVRKERELREVREARIAYARSFNEKWRNRKGGAGWEVK